MVPSFLRIKDYFKVKSNPIILTTFSPADSFLVKPGFGRKFAAKRIANFMTKDSVRCKSHVKCQFLSHLFPCVAEIISSSYSFSKILISVGALPVCYDVSFLARFKEFSLYS